MAEVFIFVPTYNDQTGEMVGLEACQNPATYKACIFADALVKDGHTVAYFCTLANGTSLEPGRAAARRRRVNGWQMILPPEKCPNGFHFPLKDFAEPLGIE